MMKKTTCMGGATCVPTCQFWDTPTGTCKISKFLDAYAFHNPVLVDVTKKTNEFLKAAGITNPFQPSTPPTTKQKPVKL